MRVRTIRVVAALLCAVLVAGSGCSRHGRPAGTARPGSSATSGTSGTPVAVGSTAHSLTWDGRERTYRLYRPRTLPTPAPLVVVLHGGFGSGQQAESSYGWDGLADRERVLVAYPDGLGRAWSAGGGCCGSSGREGVDDVGFVAHVVSAVQQSVPVDPARIYATGISNGGLLAYRLACDSTVFAAIGPVAATMLGDCAHPAPVSVIHVHGAADRNIRLDGRRGEGVAHIDGPPVPSVIAHWRAVDGCPGASVSASPPVTVSLAECPNGRAVELVTVDGAGHQWPGAARRPVVEKALGLDPPSTALDATATIYRFFAAHPKQA